MQYYYDNAYNRFTDDLYFYLVLLFKSDLSVYIFFQNKVAPYMLLN